MNRPAVLEPQGSPRERLVAHLADPLYRTGYLLIAAGAIGSLVGLLFWSVAAHAYPARIVGLNSAAISAMMFVSGVGQLGLDAVLLRYIPTAGPRVRALVVRGYVLTAVLSLLLGAVAALTSGVWSPRLSFLESDPIWLTGFALATGVWTLFTLQDSAMTALQEAHWIPIVNTLFNVAKLIMLVLLTGISQFAGPFVAWNAPAVAAVFAVSVLTFRRLLPPRRRQRIGGTIDRREMIGTATGNYVGLLFSLAANFLMPVLVTNETNATRAGYFFVPWSIAIGMTLIGVNTAASLTVEAALDESRLRLLTRRTFLHTMRLMLPAAGIVVLAAPLILRAFGARYVDAGTPLLRLLAAGTVPGAIAYIGIAVARVQHRGRAVLAIQVGQYVPQIGLSAILVPSMGIVGVGVAYLASEAFVAVALLVSLLMPLLIRQARPSAPPDDGP